MSSERQQVPRPDDDGKLILRFFSAYGGDISCGVCARYHDDGGRCEGELFVDKSSLTGIGAFINIACDTCPRESIMRRSEFLEQARANLADHHYSQQMEEADK